MAAIDDSIPPAGEETTNQGLIDILDALSMMRTNLEVVTGLGALATSACRSSGDASCPSLFAIGECVTEYGERIERQRHAVRAMVETFRG